MVTPCVLQDPHEREWVVCDKYLEQIFGCARMKLAEVPGRLAALLHAPDPIVINHVIGVEAPHDAKQTACYDIDVEVSRELKREIGTVSERRRKREQWRGLRIGSTSSYTRAHVAALSTLN